MRSIAGASNLPACRVLRAPSLPTTITTSSIAVTISCGDSMIAPTTARFSGSLPKRTTMLHFRSSRRASCRTTSIWWFGRLGTSIWRNGRIGSSPLTHAAITGNTAVRVGSGKADIRHSSSRATRIYSQCCDMWNAMRSAPISSGARRSGNGAACIGVRGPARHSPLKNPQCRCRETGATM